MNSYHSNGSRAAPARGFMTLLAMLAIGLGSMASPADAAPFAYVTNFDNAGRAIFSVIDTATNTVVTTVPLEVTNPISPIELAVAPDGKHVYVLPGSIVLVIDAATNTVVARIPVEETTFGLAVTPDSGDCPGGEGPLWGRRHPGWKTRLCRESRLQQRFGDRDGQQHGGGHGPCCWGFSP
jgi:YVTN family beta-propeller protein